MFIKKLDEKTISLISAGEVIESPSDVLKELLENSVDAKADNISIEIKNSGSDLISVKDNGQGITKEDLAICLDKYTTSKIEKIDDLYNIDTMGFRGEALSTINAVSKLKIISSVNNDGLGYVLENGEIRECSTTKGTKVVVESLFYNIPVRKKFLKSKNVEFSKIYDIFLAFSILYPNISFNFISEKKKVFLPKSSLKDRYIKIFGNDVLKNTFSLDINNKFFSLKGILTNPSKDFLYKSNFLFINRRYVNYPSLNKIVKQAYKDYLMIQQKPFFIFLFNINKRTLDVNVHPKKRFVKIQNEILFLSELKRELTQFLDKNLGKELQSQMKYNKLSNYISLPKKPVYIKENLINTNNKFNILRSKENSIIKNFDIKENFKITLFGFEIKNILGQINNTYIVCEVVDGMILVDQHAAAERINLEKNRHIFKDKFEQQNLIFPKKMDFLSEYQLDILEKNISKLKELGFNFKKENSEYILYTIPNFLGEYFDHSFFINLLTDINDNPIDKLDKIKDDIIKLKSCKMSLKSNTKLTLKQQYDLLYKLSLCKDKGICAHGRPTIIYISINNLEKMFKRIV